MTQPTKTQKIIGQVTPVLEAALHELYLIAGEEVVLADRREEADSLKVTIETARTELTDLRAQIDEGKAELERLAAERAAIKNDITALSAERREHVASLENLRKKLGEAA